MPSSTSLVSENALLGSIVEELTSRVSSSPASTEVEAKLRETEAKLLGVREDCEASLRQQGEERAAAEGVLRAEVALLLARVYGPRHALQVGHARGAANTGGHGWGFGMPQP